MAIAKVILNGDTLMDVTSNTNVSTNMLSGVVGTKNDGTSVTGNIATKTSSDLTTSGATVTAPAGYYANAASKAVSTTTHPDPTAAITSSTGVVTASHTQGTGYVTGGTTTGTLSLTTQAGKTVTPTEIAQTAVASYRWTTGPVSVAAISSTYVGTGVTTRSSADLTASGSTVTAPAGYYSTAATKSISAGSAFPPAVTITKNPTFSMNSATGVVTASYTGSSSITPTVNAGYISQGTAGTISTSGTSTYQLTTQAAQTIYPSTADQTIASNRWLTGAQTIKSVTTSNLDASNIKSGVTVNVGDANNASRIAQVTGTYSSPKKYTATIASGSTGNASNCYVRLNGGTEYYTAGNTFEFEEGDTLYCYGHYSGGQFYISVNGEAVTSTGTTAIYTYTLPAKDIVIGLYYSSIGSIQIKESVIPTAYMAGQTFTPTKNGTTVYTTSKYLTGNIVINGDQNLVSENIAEGVSIFGVEGTHSGGSGGLVYETGTWTTDGPVARPTINFANAHTTPPMFVMFVDATGTYSSTSNTNYVFVYADWYRLTGNGFYLSSTSQRFGAILYMYRTTSTTSMVTGYTTLSVNSDSSDDSDTDCSKYWVDNTSFRPYTKDTGRKWYFDRTYKWIAVWEPTT